MKVAVTGATGFIGRHVIQELKRRALVPLLVGRKPPTGELASERFVAIDVQEPSVDAFERMDRPDLLIHLAWDGLPHYHSLHHFEEQLPVQYRFLRSVIDAGLGALLVTGTCLEYGMQSGPLGEQLPAQPTTAYGLAKNILRCQLQQLQQVKSFKLTWARLFYTFGPGQAEGSLLSQLMRAVAQGQPVFNMSAGEQLRDYLPVAEVARSLVTLGLAASNAGIVNVCSGNPTSVRRLVEEWITQNRWPIALNLGHHSYPDYEPLAFWGDPRKLQACIVTPSEQRGPSK